EDAGVADGVFVLPPRTAGVGLPGRTGAGVDRRRRLARRRARPGGAPRARAAAAGCLVRGLAAAGPQLLGTRSGVDGHRPLPLPALAGAAVGAARRAASPRGGAGADG